MLNQAIKRSRKHEYDTLMKFYLCAIIVKGRNVVGVGYNKSGSSVLVEKYKVKPHHLSVHAEIDAILDAQRGEKNMDLTGCKMYVIRRLKKDSESNPSIGMSRPCKMCEDAIKAFGIKKVTYTISNNEYGVMKLCQQ